MVPPSSTCLHLSARKDSGPRLGRRIFALVLAGCSLISHLFVLEAFLVAELPAPQGTEIKSLQTPLCLLTP